MKGEQKRYRWHPTEDRIIETVAAFDYEDPRDVHPDTALAQIMTFNYHFAELFRPLGERLMRGAVIFCRIVGVKL
jgi:hypothetical protein